LLLVLVLYMTAVVVSQTSTPPNNFIAASTVTGGVKDQFLTLHNNNRSVRKVVALNWSLPLSDAALVWAKKCSFSHDPSLLTLKQGENIYACKNASGDCIVASRVLNSWLSEEKNYDCINNACYNGTTCGHYTQALWENSTILGCATSQCNTTSGPLSGRWSLAVCRYQSAGNFAGKRPYELSKCPAPPVVAVSSSAATGTDRSSFETLHFRSRSGKQVRNLTWSVALSFAAQDWAKRCRNVHDPNLANLKQGENVFACAKNSTNLNCATGEAATNSWLSQLNAYSCLNNTCLPGQKCQEFTQAMWNATTIFGCASAQCNNTEGTLSGKWSIAVCRYQTYGNVAGQRPYSTAKC